MRIFLAFLQSRGKHPLTHHAHWERYIKHGIEEAGHEWIEDSSIDWAGGLVPMAPDAQAKWRAATWERTLTTIRRVQASQRIDLFLSYLHPVQTEPDAVQEIRRLGIPTVNFFCDNVRDFRRVPLEFRVFDLHWVPETDALEMYRREALRTVFAAMPCWVDPVRRRWDHHEEHPVTFLGSPDPLRLNLLAKTVKMDVPVEIYGRGWEDVQDAFSSPPLRDRNFRALLANQRAFVRAHGMAALGRKIGDTLFPVPPESIPSGHLKGSVSDDQYFDVVQRSVLTLGINRYPSYRHPRSNPGVYSRLRDIEAPMLGACLLTEWTPDIEQLYEIGREVETYRTAEELAHKAQQMLADTVRRQELRRRGQARALNDHSIGASLETVRAALGLRSTPAKGRLGSSAGG